jgi:abortive infection bacteriophage resistance protein
MPYSKPWLSLSDQLDQLKRRGMLIEDESKARTYLERIGYYRLSGYWFAFRERSETCCAWPPHTTGGKPKKQDKGMRLPLDEFKAGATFQNAVQLYVFDKKLRLLALDALERIEIALRVDISHRLGERDRFAYLRPDLFHPTFAQQLDPKTGLTAHQDWLAKQATLIQRSKEEFIRHNRDKYGLPLAIWVACEVWDFGCMSKLFGGLQEADQDRIAQRYGIRNGRFFASWLRSLNYLRNVCAHHCRLWNRNITEQPKLPPVAELPALQGFHGNAHRLARPFLLLCLTQHLMQHVNPSSSWGQRLRRLLLEDFPKLDHLGLNLAGMGADEDWEQRVW